MSKYWYFRMRLVVSGRYPPDRGRRIDAFGPAECRVGVRTDIFTSGLFQTCFYLIIK